jgi:hypothetical protein
MWPNNFSISTNVYLKWTKDSRHLDLHMTLATGQVCIFPQRRSPRPTNSIQFSTHTRVPSSTYSSLYLTSTIGPSLPKPNASHNWNSSSLSLPIPNHFLPPPLPGSSGASLRSNRHNTCASVSFNCKYARFLPLHCLVPILNGLKALRASRIDSGDVVGDSIQREGSNVNGLVK